MLVEWIAALLAKRLSSVVRNLAQSVNSLVNFFLSISVFRQSSAYFRVPLVLAALCVVQAVVMFACPDGQVSMDKPQKKAAQDVC